MLRTEPGPPRDPRPLDRFANACTHGADRHWRVLLLAFSVAFFTSAAVHAIAKPLWHDEIYTVIIAGLPSLATIWNAQLAGIDSMPPLNAILTHFVFQGVEPGAISARLPAMLGVWTCALAMFVLVRARAGTMAGLAAMLLVCVSRAWGAAYEARGYGVRLGLFALAILAWAEAARGQRRRLFLPLLAVALAAGVWTHYYAAIGFIPIVAGELVRSARTRKVDVGILASVILAGLACLPLYPLAKVAQSQSSTYFQKTTLLEIPGAFASIVLSLAGPWALLAGGLALISVLASATTARQRTPIRLPAHEVIAGLAVLLTPVWAMLLGLLVASGAFVPRYAITAVVGYCLAVALLTSWSRSRLTAVLVVGLLAAGVAYDAREALQRGAAPNPLDYRPLLRKALSAATPVPVVVTGTLYLQMWYYAPAEARPRLTYVADPSIALRRLGTDSLDRDYLVLRKWSTVSVQDYEEFSRTHSRFYLYDVEALAWLLDHLRDQRAEIRELGRESGATMYEVTYARRTPA